MSSYERKNGDLVMFEQRNQTNPKAPRWKGTLLWNGEELDVACWVKRDGAMLAGNAQQKRAKGEYQKKPQFSEPKHERSYEAQRQENARQHDYIGKGASFNDPFGFDDDQSPPF